MYLLFYLMTAYLLGSVMSGYIIGKIFGTIDIRKEGSGNVGARNAGRLLGKKAFTLTFLGDALKGFLVVYIPFMFFQMQAEYVILGLAAAVLGHLKPITLRFQGGKGVSTLIGGLAALDYQALLITAGLFLILYLLFRNFTIAGLLSIIGIPIILYLNDYAITSCLLMLGVIVLVILAHKDNVHDFFKGAGGIDDVSL